MMIKTEPCIVCGKTSEVEVDSAAYFRWKQQGWLIQVAFPDLDADQRELIKTGTHPACWETLAPDDEDPEPSLLHEEGQRDWLDALYFEPPYDDGSNR